MTTASVAGLTLSALAIVQALAMASLFTGVIDGLPLAELWQPFTLLALALLLKPFFTATRELIAHHAASKMKRKVRSKILSSRAARGSFATPEKRIGAQHALLTDGVENLEPYVTRYVPQIFVTTLTALAAVALLIVIDPLVGVVTGMVALVVPLIPRFWDRLLRRNGDQHWGAYAALHAEIVDALRGMETLKLLGAERRRRTELANASHSLLRTTLRQLRISLIESGLTSFLQLGGSALALTLGVARVQAGALDAAALFAIAFVSFEVFRPFRDLSTYWHAGYLGLTVGSQLIEQLTGDSADTHGSGTASSRAVPRSPLTASQAARQPRDSNRVAIRLTDVHARYPGSSYLALDNLSLSINRGSVTAIVGPSGAGKSTIANLMLGLLSPEQGEVTIAAARPVDPDSPTPVAFVSQQPTLFSGTLRENLLLVAPERSDEQLCAALRRAQAAELATEAALNTQVGDGGSLLSGGQRQRVAIARALLRGSPILLLDEATSALDMSREQTLFAELRTAAADEQSLTVVIIAHRLTAVESADHIIVVSQGSVVEQGSYHELLTADGLFTQLHRAQAERVGA